LYAQDDLPVQDEPVFESSLGLRVGLSLGPEQMVVGAQTIALNFVQIFRFAPSIDMGFGDDRTVFAANLDVQAELIDNWFYLGAGPTLVVDQPRVETEEDREDELEVGFAVISGLYLPIGSKRKYNLEIRYDLSQDPDFKVMIGYLF
jgi:hypothetical protein